MGLFSWLFGEKQDPVFVDGYGDFDLEVVGESHYQDALCAACGPHRPEGYRKEIRAVLLCDDKNRYDPQAVCVRVSGRTVGYLSREDAQVYRRRLRKVGHEGLPIEVNAVIVGGKKLGLFKKTSFGIWLDFPIDDL